MPGDFVGDVIGDVIGDVVGDVIGDVDGDVDKFINSIVEENNWERDVDLISIAYTVEGPFDIQNVVAKLDLDRRKYRLRLKVVKGEVNLDDLKWDGVCAGILSVFSNAQIEKCIFPLSPEFDTLSNRATKDIVTPNSAT